MDNWIVKGSVISSVILLITIIVFLLDKDFRKIINILILILKNKINN